MSAAALMAGVRLLQSAWTAAGQLLLFLSDFVRTVDNTTGPAVVAVSGTRFGPNPPTLVARAIGMLAIMLVVLAVYSWALLKKRYDLQRLGFDRISWLTPLISIALTIFFVLIFGPIAYWLLTKSGTQTFATGIAATNHLPIGYIVQAIVIVASAEELLYRGYAIERLADLTGSYWLASILAVLAFGLAHVPLWGWAPAATTIISGGILTIVFLWRRDLLALVFAHIATDIYGTFPLYPRSREVISSVRINAHVPKRPSHPRRAIDEFSCK